MTTLGDIRSWSFDELRRAAAACLAYRDTVLALQDEHDAAAPPPSWSGQGHRAARDRHERMADGLRQVVAQTAAVGQALQDAAASITMVRTLLAESEQLAARYNFILGDDNRVLDAAPPDVDVSGPDLADRRRMMAELLDRVEQILRTAVDTDSQLAGVLRAATRGDTGGRAPAALVRAAAAGTRAGGLTAVAPPRPGTPVDNAAWWSSLTPEQRQEVIRTQPATVGNLDGVPAAVRSSVNRARLAAEQTTTAAEVTRLEKRLSGRFLGGLLTNDDAHLGVARDRLADLRAVERTLARPGRNLLLLDNSGEMVKAAVAVGDVDTADRVSVYTPGMNSTTRGDLENKDAEQSDLRTEVVRQLEADGRGAQAVASVTWMGYRPPATGGFVDDFSNDDEATSSSAARVGATQLHGFLNGLDATRLDDAQLTAQGHSYGSLTTSLALQQGTGVDNAVFAGSPGLGTDTVDDLMVAPGHVFVAEASRDAVADLGYYGPDPNQMRGVTTLSTEAGLTPDGSPRSESVGHSAYGQDGSMSQYNTAAVIAGRTEAITPGRHFGIGDALQWSPWR